MINSAPFLIGILFAVFCAVMLRYALRNLRAAENSAHWPTVTGRLSQVKLWGTRNIDGEMKAAEKLSVTYEYAVQKQSCTGHRVAFYTLVYPDTLTFVESHPQGCEVQVFYDPEQPRESVLVPGIQAGKQRFSEVILAMLGLLVSMLVVVLAFLGVIGSP